MKKPSQKQTPTAPLRSPQVPASAPANQGSPPQERSSLNGGHGTHPNAFSPERGDQVHTTRGANRDINY